MKHAPKVRGKAARSDDENGPKPPTDRPAEIRAGLEALTEILAGEIAVQQAEATKRRAKIMDRLHKLAPQERHKQEHTATLLLSHAVRLESACAVDPLFSRAASWLQLAELQSRPQEFR